MKDFYIKLKELEYSWSDLKILLSAYDKNKTFDLKEKILDKSEETWVLSMETLDTAQKLYDEKILEIFSRSVLKKITKNEPGWEQMLPEGVADIIKRDHLFGYQKEKELAE